MFAVLKSKINLMLAAIVAVILSACASNGPMPQQGDYLLKVHEEGRTYVF